MSLEYFGAAQNPTGALQNWCEHYWKSVFLYHKIISFEWLLLRLVGLHNDPKEGFWWEMKGGFGSYDGGIKVTQNRSRTFEEYANREGNFGRSISLWDWHNIRRYVNAFGSLFSLLFQLFKTPQMRTEILSILLLTCDRKSKFSIGIAVKSSAQKWKNEHFWIRL